jgi:hypothetical protein
VRDALRTLAGAAAVAALLAGGPAAAQSAPSADGLSAWQRLIAPRGDAYARELSTAALHAARGDHAAAEQACRAAIGLRPERVEGWSCALGSLFAQTRDEELRAEAARLAAASPALAAAPEVRHWTSLASARSGDAAGAAAELRAALRFAETDQNGAIWYGNLGELYAAAGDHVSAVRFYRHALGLNEGYALARLGLAASLERLGDSDSARRELLRVALDETHPGGSSATLPPDASNRGVGVLETPGLFAVHEGEFDLWRALYWRATGRGVAATEALARFAASPAGLREPELVARLGATPVAAAEVRRVDVSACSVGSVALAPDGSRAAVSCAGDTIREGAISADRLEGRTVGGLGFQQCCTWGGAVGDYVMDLAYAPDGRGLRILYTDGQAEQAAVAGGLSQPLFTWDASSVRALSFVGDGSRVLLASQMSGGATVLPWGPVSGPITPTPTSNSHWISWGRASTDGTRMAVNDGSTLSVYELSGSLWQLRATVALPGSAWGNRAALSDDGTRVATAAGELVVVQDVATSQPLAFVSLPGLRSPTAEPMAWIEAISFVRWQADGTLVAGGDGAFWIARLPE